MKPVLYVMASLFNEAENVPPLVSDLVRLQELVGNEFATRIVMVDDGSSDGTAGVLRKEMPGLELEILKHDRNQGPGAAFGTAFEHLAKKINQEDWIATMEGDNTSRIDTLLQMLTRRKEGYDVVLASPYAYGGGFVGTPWWRKATSHLANELTMSVLRLYGLRVLSSFFRLHSGRTLLTLQDRFGPRIVEMPGFEWALEMLYKMALLNVRMSEVETLVDWRKRAGASKMRMLRTIRGYARVLLTHARWKAVASPNTPRSN